MLFFGYKQNRIFTIDCLTATLMDCMWANALKDMQKLLLQKEDMLNRESFQLQKKLNNLEKKYEGIEKQIKDEEAKKNAELAKDEKKKPGSKAPPPAKKKIDASNPLEKEKAEVQAEMDKNKENNNKYLDKLTKLRGFKEKFTNMANNNNLVLELVDKQGERKFVKGKMETMATFLTDRGSYSLAIVKENPEEENPLELVNIDGYCLRTLEEDEKAMDEDQNILEKNKKDTKKKGGKK